MREEFVGVGRRDCDDADRVSLTLGILRRGGWLTRCFLLPCDARRRGAGRLAGLGRGTPPGFRALQQPRPAWLCLPRTAHPPPFHLFLSTSSAVGLSLYLPLSLAFSLYVSPHSASLLISSLLLLPLVIGDLSGTSYPHDLSSSLISSTIRRLVEIQLCRSILLSSTRSTASTSHLHPSNCPSSL